MPETCEYRWWTVSAWRWGLKLGPISVLGYWWNGPQIALCVNGWTLNPAPTFDTGLRGHRP